MLDVRSLRMNRKAGVVEFVIEDRLELDGMKNIAYQPSEEGVMSNFKREASLLV